MPHLDEAECAGQAGLADELVHPPLGGHVLLGPVKQQVGELGLGGEDGGGGLVAPQLPGEPAASPRKIVTRCGGGQEIFT